MRLDDSYRSRRMALNSLSQHLSGPVAILAGIVAGHFVAAFIAYLSTGSAFGNPGSELYGGGDTRGIGAIILSLYVAEIGIFVLLRNEQSLQWAASVGLAEILAMATGSGTFGLIWLGLIVVWLPIGLVNLVQTQVKPLMWLAVSSLATAGVNVAWNY